MHMGPSQLEDEDQNFEHLNKQADLAPKNRDERRWRHTADRAIVFVLPTRSARPLTMVTW